MERYGKYKDSGVEWIGEIPEGWGVKKLIRTVEKLTNGYVGPTRGIMQPEGIPYIQGIHIKNNTIRFTPNGNYYVSKEWSDAHEKSILKTNDLLVVQTGTIGDVGIVSNEFEGANCHALLIVRVDETVFCPKYCLYLLISPYGYASLQQIKTGEILFHINGSKLKGIDMLVPPLSEQASIANYLDRKTAEIDELIAQKERLIELYEEEKTAIINQAVTKGIDPDVRLKDSSVDWLGEIPEEWEVKRLRYVGNCQNGVSKGADYFGTGFPFVSYSDVYNNFVLPQNVEGLANSTEIDQVNYSVIKGDIFFTRTSETIEEIGISSTCLETINRAIFSGFLIRFRPFDGILFEGFSKYFFRSKLHRLFFVKEMNLVTRASLSQELLKRLPVILPPFPEQCEIASYLDQATSSIDAKIAKTKRIIELQKEYRTALISEVVTGKIKVAEETTS